MYTISNTFVDQRSFTMEERRAGRRQPRRELRIRDYGHAQILAIFLTEL